MGKYNLDEVIERRNTNSVKYDQLEERFGASGLDAFWVADMDFLSPPAITEAIIKRAQHGVYGYTYAPASYYESIINWLDRYHHWKIQREWISFIPGVVKGIGLVIDCFLDKNDKVVIQSPVYHPFKIVSNLHERGVLENPLMKDANGDYQMDLDGLDTLLTNNADARLLILCNPHNPIGVAWSKDTLVKVAEICDRHKVLVISDEIHSDLVFEKQGYVHTPFATVSEVAANNCITLMAPSKTFNIAGIISSFSIISNKEIRTKFKKYLEKFEMESAHLFAYPATEAAYNHGEEWLEEVKDYLWQNVLFVDEYIQKEIPRIKVIKPQASYLIWLDCSDLGMSAEELNEFFIHKAGLALNNGMIFGQEGRGYMRFNIGTPKSVVEKGLKKLKKAVDNLA